MLKIAEAALIGVFIALVLLVTLVYVIIGFFRRTK